MLPRLAILTRLLLLPLVGSPLVAGQAPEAPFVLDCGPVREDRDDDEGSGEDSGEVPSERLSPRRLQDVRYSRRLGYGHEGGEGFRRWYAGATAIWGRPEPDLYASGRSSPESYRFDLPAGKYLIALGFCELEEHLAGRRVFDVVAQGRVALRGVDPFAIGGYGQSFRLIHVAEVGEREGLTVGLRRAPESRRPPFVNAIWVYPDRDHGAPEQPETPRGAGSYGMNALFWEPAPDVAGYVVERARGESSFERLTPEPVPVARWTDHDVSPGTTCRYRVRAVDVRGRYGPPSRAIALSPRSPEESSFPLYSLTLKDDDLASLHRDVHSDLQVPATFALGGKDYAVRLRIRGAVSRFAAKLSYHVTFLEATPFGERRVIYIKAEPGDYTLQQTKLTCDVFAAFGAPAGDARYVNLMINGRYQGVYLDVERIDRAFLARRGLKGTLFRAGSFQQLGREAGRKRGRTGSRKELLELIRAVNRIDRGEFESFVRAATDWPALRDYLVASAICHRSEIEANDYFYCHVSGERWILLPWDHNNGNFGVFGSRTREPFMPLFGQTLQGTGHWNSYWYVLASRVLHQPRLRREYLDRLEHAAREWLASGKVESFIAANHEALRREIVVDPYRWPPGDDEPFERSADDLGRFVRRHAARLLDAIRRERLRPEPAVVINEFQLGPRRGWVELHNRGGASVSLAGCSVGSLDRAYQAWHRFRGDERLEGGAFRVVEVAYPARTRLVAGEDDVEWLEALELAEREGRPPPSREARREGPPVPGGIVALVGRSPRGSGGPEDRERERPDEAEPELLDWYFFGHQTSRFSYGRVDDGFAFLTPTPGEANPTEGLQPPALLADGDCRGHRGGHVLVYAAVDTSVPGSLPHSVTLHYSLGGPWRDAPMAIDDRLPQPRFLAPVQTTAATTEIFYYFVARTEAGVERPAPLTAPAEAYRHAIREVD